MEILKLELAEPLKLPTVTNEMIFCYCRQLSRFELEIQQKQ